MQITIDDLIAALQNFKQGWAVPGDTPVALRITSYCTETRRVVEDFYDVDRVTYNETYGPCLYIKNEPPLIGDHNGNQQEDSHPGRNT